MFEILAVRIINQTSRTEQEDANDLIIYQALFSVFQWVPASYDAVTSGRKKKTCSDGFELNSD